MALLEDEHRSAIAVLLEVARCVGVKRIVEDELDFLRRPPLLGAELKQLRECVGWLRQERDHLNMASDAIDYVSKNV